MLLEPYSPLNLLKPVAENIWVVDGPEIRMDWLMLKVPFNTRMTIVRLPGNELWVHSPIQPDENLFSALKMLGRVRHLVAPNTLHYSYLADWSARFPEAETWGPPNLAEKAKSPLPAFEVLSDCPPDAWKGAFDQVIVEGDVVTEVDFFHRSSRTLILTDLIENFEPAKVRNPFWRFLIRFTGASDPDGKAPIDLRATFWRHLPSVRRAVRQMLEWSPERVILAHGRWYDRNGTAEIRRGLRWALR